MREGSACVGLSSPGERETCEGIPEWPRATGCGNRPRDAVARADGPPERGTPAKVSPIGFVPTYCVNRHTTQATNLYSW